MESTVNEAGNEGGSVTEVLPDCPKCGDTGWVWWDELDEYHGPAVECGWDHTRYSCDHESHKKVRDDIPLPDCARHLTRLRPRYVCEKQEHISTLIEQCKNYERGNTYLGRRMIETMERIEAAKAAITAGDI